VILIVSAAYAAVLRTGASPFVSSTSLAMFGFIWMGLYSVSQVTRPARIAVALAMLPAFKRMVNAIQRKLSCSHWLAVAWAMFWVDVLNFASAPSGLNFSKTPEKQMLQMGLPDLEKLDGSCGILLLLSRASQLLYSEDMIFTHGPSLYYPNI